MKQSLQQRSPARPAEPIDNNAARVGRGTGTGMGLRVALWFRAGALAAGIALAGPAMATTGYFQLGYGAKSVGMAGVGVANPQDTLAGASNPAGMAHVGEGFDIGFRLFSPDRSASLGCPGPACTQSTISDDSDNDLFLIPDGGYTTRINDKMFAGVSVYGNGGMNTSYPTNLFAESGAQSMGAPPGAGTAAFGKLGVDLVQLMVAPTVTYEVAEGHTLGISPVFAVQRFSAHGFGPFAGLSSDAANLTNNGDDWSYGLGVRIGWLGEIGKSWRLGATYASKTYMTKLDKYSGLFADSGSFDIPANAAIGIAVDPIENLTFAFDVQRIFYGDVDSIANPGPTPAELSPFGTGPTADRRLGASNGIGFGWEDIWVYKIGASYKINNAWTVRAGYSHNDSPIPDSEVLFNIVAPAVNEDHVTLGFSFKSSKKSEWNFSYMHAFERTQTDPSTSFGGAPASITMYQNAVNFSYTRTFD
jgi:long-chain fatty acid transport protein